MSDMNDKAFFYRQRKARNLAIGVAGYFVAIACLLGFIVAVPVKGVFIGLVLMFLVAAASTGLIVYTRISTPLEYLDRYRMFGDYESDGYDDGSYDRNGPSSRDVSTEAAGGNGGEGGAAGASGAAGESGFSGRGAYSKGYRKYYRNSPEFRLFRQIMEIYWLLVTVVYLAVSFTTMSWGITWIIWLIAAALEKAIRIIYEVLMDNRNGR